MDGCPYLANLTVGNSSFTWSQAWANKLNVTVPSYFRPDTGSTLLPWAYTMLVVIVHLPMVIIRVMRWENVQIWCLVSTSFVVLGYIQAYVSTEFDPAKILVWTPLILVIDAGSMAQIFFLVIEAKKVRIGSRVVLFDPEDNEEEESRRALPVLVSSDNATIPRQAPHAMVQYSPLWNHKYQHSRRSPQVIDQEIQERSTGDGEATAAFRAFGSTSRAMNDEHSLRWYRDPAAPAAISAVLLFIAVLALQIIGLAKASVAHARRSAAPPTSWCSPLLQPFGLALVDGDCHVYNINQSRNQGIGCIDIPGVWQNSWITGTVAGVIIELILELGDVLILACVNGSPRWRGVKMKRPWATMFSGVIVLFVTLLYGVIYASTLPPGITERVTVVMDVQGPASYSGYLTGSGLRGAVIGWSDGFFSSWNVTYFGG